ncbi:MAG: efflux RND transporter periplasmic adaptor subunit [Bacteroidales bacterium]|nr:efflux RND transporter periplasmic adaptor subunit [Bacteroidales bacterium]
MKRKYIIWIALLFVTIVVTVIAVKGKKQHAFMVEVEKPQLRDITEMITANGKIQPEKEVKISADVSGEITELLVKEGDKIKEGQVLVKINPEIYQSQIERMEASLNASKAQLLQSEAQLIDKENQFNRQKKLYEQNAISELEYEQAETNFKVSKASFDAANFSVLSSEASLKEAKENLRKTTIYAPISGTVSQLNVEQGERVVGTMQMTGTEIMRIANLNRMEVKVDVNENDIIRVKKNDTAYIEVDAYLDRKFKGLVTEIANSANTTGTSVDQVTNFEVKILILSSSYQDLIDTLSNKRYPFRPGMSATVDIRTETETQAISLPIEAVTAKSDSSNPDELNEMVYLFNNGFAKGAKVKTGIQNNQYIVIESGIDTSMEVITAPYTIINKQLKEGSAVEKMQGGFINKEKAE